MKPIAPYARLRAGSGSTISASGAARGEVEGQVVTFGKRLTDTLYLTYEQGMGLATTGLRIKYTLTRYLTLRFEAGTTQVSGVGVYFNRSYP